MNENQNTPEQQAENRMLRNRAIADLRSQYPHMSYAEASAQVTTQFPHLCGIAPQPIENRAGAYMQSIRNRNSEIAAELDALDEQEPVQPGQCEGDLFSRVREFMINRNLTCSFAEGWNLARQNRIIP